MINAYNHDELKFGQDRVYHNTSGGDGGWKWNASAAAAGEAAEFFPVRRTWTAISRRR